MQVRQYQGIIRKMLGKGIVGVGQRRGLIFSGEILVLVYNLKENKALSVQSLKGYSIFARFRERTELSGLSLDELRQKGLKADRRDMHLWRIFFRYKQEKPTKQKGALIQAVEGIEQYLRTNSDTLGDMAGKTRVTYGKDWSAGSAEIYSKDWSAGGYNVR